MECIKFVKEELEHLQSWHANIKFKLQVPENQF